MTDNTLHNAITVLHRRIPSLAGVENYQHTLPQVIFVKTGVLSLSTNIGRFFVPPGQAIIIPANVTQKLYAELAVEISVFYFENSELTESIENTRVIAVSPFLQSLMIESAAILPDFSWQGASGRLLRLIRDYLFDMNELDVLLPYAQDERLTNITDKLIAHPSLKSDLVSWGKFVNASSRTLTRNFKKETGITYSEWRQRLNVQVAIKHLAQGDSIGEIATLLGYESSSAFIFMFKKQMGVSPNRFLNTNY